MAILAIELHRTVGAGEIMLHVYCVIEFDCCRIAAAGSHGRELRMAAVKVRDVAHETGGHSGGMQNLRWHWAQLALLVAASCCAA